MSRFRTVAERPIIFAISAYWAMFWLLNALDKVLAQTHLGVLHWWGNHRVEKFTMYFDRLDIDAGWVVATLLALGVIELGAAALFVWVLAGIAGGHAGVLGRLGLGVAASIAILFGFGVFDIVVGDRAELLEHSTYVGVLLVSYLAGAAEMFFDQMRRQAATPAE
jgi:hypothetical protein